MKIKKSWGFIIIAIILILFLYLTLEQKNNEVNVELLHVVLYEDKNLNDYHYSAFEEKLNKFNTRIEKGTHNNITSEAKLKFLDINKLGDEDLKYENRSIHQWKSKINEKLKPDYSYNILSFSPLENISWCTDAHSYGHNKDGLIYFCLEQFLYLEGNNVQSTNSLSSMTKLMIHKTFHGFGFHHATQHYKQLTLRDGRQHGLPNRGEGQYSEFSNYTLKALGKIPENNFNENCHWDDWFECKQDPKRINTCKPAYGSYCFDADNDGVLDLKDPYPLSSPIEGRDTTNDGIVDHLDLCPWNKINVEGSKNPYDILKLVVEDINEVRLSFSSPNNIKKIEIIENRYKPGQPFRFPKENKETIRERNTLKESDFPSIEEGWRIWRIKVYYEYNNEKYYRPFFLYESPVHEEVEYLYEKEWMYFSRFGCDIPAEINLLDKDTYDENRDGLPDKDKFDFAQMIDKDYDWSDDGIPDIKDPLPTIENGCKKTSEGYDCIHSPFKDWRNPNDPYEISLEFLY